MRSKSSISHPTSSIYWDSVDSSGGSSGSGSRNYVDPWDLENYAYFRRHSIAAASTPQPIYQTSQRANRASYSDRMSRHSPVESDYWYAPAIREPGYDAPASVEEIYFRPSRPVSTACYYHQPIYEDETTSHYAAPFPLYSHLSELEHAEALEELRTRETMRRRSKVARSKNHERGECIYHRRPSEMLMMDMAARSRNMEEEEESVDEIEAIRYRKPVKSSHITLNTYGHLKIDYTNSWDSLHRKIVSK